jgi:hypothetical protein
MNFKNPEVTVPEGLFFSLRDLFHLVRTGTVTSGFLF